MSTIILPQIKTPDSGLFLRNGVYFMTYTENGVRKQRSLGTTKIDKARQHRDQAHVLLLTQGATIAARQKKYTLRRGDRVKGNPDAYLRQRKPWVVVIGGKTIAECDTNKQARAARDNYLKENTP